MPERVFGNRIGKMTFAEFDLGLVKAIGGTVVDKKFVS